MYIMFWLGISHELLSRKCETLVAWSDPPNWVLSSTLLGVFMAPAAHHNSPKRGIALFFVVPPPRFYWLKDDLIDKVIFTLSIIIAFLGAVSSSSSPIFRSSVSHTAAEDMSYWTFDKRLNLTFWEMSKIIFQTGVFNLKILKYLLSKFIHLIDLHKCACMVAGRRNN